MGQYELDDIRETRTNRDNLVAKFDAQLAELVHIARAKGCTWEQIAQALGVARQAAWERYGRTAGDPQDSHPPTS